MTFFTKLKIGYHDASQVTNKTHTTMLSFITEVNIVCHQNKVLKQNLVQ